MATIGVLLRKAEAADGGEDQTGQRSPDTDRRAERQTNHRGEGPGLLDGAGQNEQGSDRYRSRVGESGERLFGGDDPGDQHRHHPADHRRRRRHQVAHQDDEDDDHDGQREPGLPGQRDPPLSSPGGGDGTSIGSSDGKSRRCSVRPAVGGEIAEALQVEHHLVGRLLG